MNKNSLLAVNSIVVAIIFSLVGILVSLKSNIISAETDKTDIKTICKGNVNYYSKDYLRESELKNFPADATAYEVTTEQGKIRIISQIVRSPMNEASLKLTFTPQYNLATNLSIRLSSSDAKTDIWFEDQNLQGILANSQGYFLANKPLEQLNGQKEFDLIVEKNDQCLFKVPSIIEDMQKQISKVSETDLTSLNKNSNFVFKSGDTLQVFDDWYMIDQFEKYSLKFLQYNDKNNAWENLPETDGVVAPGKVYLVYNSGEEVTISPSEIFTVPRDYPKRILSLGWNLISNFTANPLGIKDLSYSVVPSGKNLFSSQAQYFSLDKLLADKKIIDTAYLVGEDKNIGRKDSNQITLKDYGIQKFAPGQKLWVYLQDDELVLQGKNLQVSIETEKLKFTKNENIRLVYTISNQSKQTYYVDKAGVEDICQYGYKITDSNGKAVTAKEVVNLKDCPSRVDQIELKPGKSIKQVYTFKAAELGEGSFDINAYFDYTRLNSPGRLNKKISIQIDG